MNIYRGMMKTAVRVKRILTGNSAQSRYTKYLEEIQFKTPEELNALQAVSLCELMTHAVENIPFYKYLENSLELTPKSAFDDIQKFPLISKEDIRNNREAFIDIKVKNIEYIPTGGTMGERVLVLMDKYFTDHAVDSYFNNKIGIYSGTSRLRVIDIDRTIITDKSKKNNYLSNPLTGRFFIDHRFMDEKKYSVVINILKKNKPEIVWGITHGVYAIAKYIVDNEIDIKPMKLALTGGANLIPRYKKIIEKAFKTKVYDRYASAETGNMANQCLEREGYHYVPVVHYIEILDENMKPVRDGETGSLYVTTLAKRAMPLIRYQIGDLVVKTEKTCSCGSRFPMIGSISGREREGVTSPSGSYISSSPFDIILSNSGKVIEFQVIQLEMDSILIKLVCDNEELTDDENERIKSEVIKCLDYPMNIEIKNVNDIKPLSNGKRIHIISLDRNKELREYLNEII
ncbi:MAG: phenylacetate--CoA ligase family protein [Clostridiales bacterium]|nr:phenylacetate--CoA ligase family protein [Clostridiales bacterium]